MVDLIVFSVDNNKYALNIENVQRIIQAIEITLIPNIHPYIDGMMSYEDSVIKILNFRKLIGLPTYNDELIVLFTRLKEAHKEWLNELKLAIENDETFTKTTDPNICELGKWLNDFNSYDDTVSAVLKDLIDNHKKLHQFGKHALEVYEYDKDEAKNILDNSVYKIFNSTMGDMDIFIYELEKVSNSLQKLIFYEHDGFIFAIKVDKIEDIAHIEENDIMISESDSSDNEFLELSGILDLNGVLINIIKTIKLPS